MPLFKRKTNNGQTASSSTKSGLAQKALKNKLGRTISETISSTNELGKKDTETFGMGNTKFKSYSDDKKYVTKGKTDASGAVTKMKARRTIKGALTGAPKLSKNR
jgi:hypothetical protein